jgi:ribosome recycling factor
MVDKVRKETEDRMHKSVEKFRVDLLGVRTGKASPAILDSVRVDYY